jgi:GH24 family phage-related lysozyme (muramidase)
MTEAAVSHLVKVDLSQCGLDAVVSFTFNVGTGTRLWVGGLLDNADSTVPREGGSQG